ncbi:MAG TPA: hypothetical protein VI670_20835 [Thermoanaerobaculia bacterium]|jgi:hypothetical protein
MVFALPLYAQNDIQFDPATTQEEFAQFSRTMGQAIFATPVQPARATSLIGFDVGVAATLVKVDENASWWRHAVPPNSDFLTGGGYAAVPRLVASKGFGFATVSGTYAKVQNSDVKTYGGAIDVPIVRGSALTPELAARGSYATISGVDAYKLKTYGLELFLSKGFGPITPYGAIGRQRTNATGTIIVPTNTITLTDTSNINRYTAGVRFSLLVPKIVIEATRAEVTSYAAKISVGF